PRNMECEASGEYDQAKDATVCTAGSYSPCGDRVCEETPAGYYQPAHQAGVDYDADTTRCSENSGGATAIERDPWCTGGTCFRKCGEGTYSGTGAASCHVCPPGTTSNEAHTACQNCPVGEYTPGPGQGCVDAPPGTYTRVEGSSCARLCPPHCVCEGRDHITNTLAREWEEAIRAEAARSPCWEHAEHRCNPTLSGLLADDIATTTSQTPEFWAMYEDGYMECLRAGGSYSQCGVESGLTQKALMIGN
ncbi:unnamed protein product, partial [marine sediment metagenome]